MEIIFLKVFKGFECSGMDNFEPTDFEEAPLDTKLIYIMFRNEI